MNVLLIGHSVVDNIDIEDGPKQLKPGGLFYAATGLNSMKDEADRLYLLTAIDEENYHHFELVYNNLELKFANRVEQVPKINLKIWKDKERHECYNNFTDKLDVTTVGDFTIFDGIYVNMISGMDINISDFEYIRSKFAGPVYIDIHTLSRGVDAEGKRYFRKIPEAERWLNCADIVQVNEKELFTLSDLENEEEIVKFVLRHNCNCLIVTDAEHGGRVYSNFNSATEKFIYKAIKVKSVNKVGCGDIFGSVFFYNFLKSDNVKTSIKIANIAAGISSTYSKTNEFKNLKLDIDGFKN